MSRQPSGTDFVVHVDGIGTFTFAKREMRDQFRIGAEYARLTEGVSPVPEDLGLAASAFSQLTVLTVAAPEGWDISALDPFDEESYAKILKVWGALRSREDQFRKGSAKDGAAAGA